MHLSNDQKVEIVTKLYEDQRKEAVFWRERNYKITTWLVGLLLAVSAAAIYADARYPIVLVPLFSLAIIGTIYLSKNFRRYSEVSSRLAQVQEALKLFEDGTYLPNVPLFEKRLRHVRPDRRGTGSFIAAIWVIAISTAIAVVFKIP